MHYTLLMFLANLRGFIPNLFKYLFSRFIELKTEVLLSIKGSIPEVIDQLLQNISRFRFENNQTMPLAKVTDNRFCKEPLYLNCNFA